MEQAHLFAPTTPTVADLAGEVDELSQRRARPPMATARMTYIGMPRAVLNELKERRGTPTATSGELYRPYGEDVHNFWHHQTLVRSGAD